VDDEGCISTIEEVSGITQANGALTGRSERGAVDLTGRELASMNMWVFPPAIFAGLQEYFDEFRRSRGGDPAAEALLPEAIDRLIQQRVAPVRAIESPGPWFGLTHPDDRRHVVAALRALHEGGEYPTPLWRE
jgi:hypothetical protein